MNDVLVQCAHSRINQAVPWERYRVKEEEIVEEIISKREIVPDDENPTRNHETWLLNDENRFCANVT